MDLRDREKTICADRVQLIGLFASLGMLIPSANLTCVHRIPLLRNHPDRPQPRLATRGLQSAN